MKLSNKILIGFFGTILLYTLMSFAEIRIKGNSKVLNGDNAISETLPLEGLKYLVIHEDLDKRITINSSSEPRFEIKSIEGNFLSKMEYELSGDTLFLKKFNLKDDEKHFQVIISVPKNGFNGFSMKSAYVHLTEIKQKSLSISQSGGRLDIDNEVDLVKLDFVSSNKGTSHISNASIDTITVAMNHSDLRLNSDIQSIEGFLSNESDLFSNGSQNIQLKRDKSSRIRMY